MSAAQRLAAAGLLAALAACGERAPRVEFDPGPTPAELAGGEEIFNRNCLLCHGELAAGSDSGPPLVHVYYEPNHHADIAFQRAIEFGVQPHHWNYGPMPPVPGLDREEIRQVTEYVRWLQRRAGVF